jgi:hypothetical protein
MSLRVMSSIYPVSLPLSLLNPSGGSGGLARGGVAWHDLGAVWPGRESAA